MPRRFSIAESVISDFMRPVAEGKTSPSPRPSSRASASTSSALSESGTLCSRLDFMRAAGTVHVRASRSISSHRAPRTSPERAAVSTRNSKASRVPAPCPTRPHRRQRAIHPVMGQCPVVGFPGAILRQRRAQGVHRVVRAVSLGNRPAHHRAVRGSPPASTMR